MARSTVHYANNETNNILKRLHNKLRPAGTPVERVEYIIELLLLRVFEVKLKQEEAFFDLRALFDGEDYRYLFSSLLTLSGDQVLTELNKRIFPFYANITAHARKVLAENPSAEIQDQLVLMEEVFANSNFTNNVKGGVVHEVIQLVNAIDEATILQTDLLGDAIESALSETGGTRDLGLHRTPDHIRKLMVEMVDPDFSDIIFDPATGTAGLLFDAFDYALDKAERTRNFPPAHIANQFYRMGLSGIEYSGRIRKMAAVNMYIRHLNPHNIEQGDSLRMFDPARDAETKTVILTNPPFGAERDQDSYPNVWEDFSREAETTILFVKLIYEHLKRGGRCAVVVSEGFMTWGQRSAVALRKLLLTETNLRAIISLPQGVFVSKGGAGPKTSILYFEKGQATEFVWFYKITNDGFTLGTNRKPMAGSQIPELLEIFKTVQQGIRPPDTRHSFCIPREWMETLDPRAADRLRDETRATVTERNAIKREKRAADLEKQRAANKMTDAQIQEKLEQFDALAAIQVESEIAKALDNAHTYSFNLPNYRSNLAPAQLQQWRALVAEIEPQNGTSIEARYHALQTADSETALRILASFDPQNALEVDIASAYLMRIGEDGAHGNAALQGLGDLLRKGTRYPFVALRDYLVLDADKIKPSNMPEAIFTVLGVSNETGIFINEKLVGAEIRQSYYRVRTNQFCYNPYRVNVGSIGLNEFDYENQIISGAYNVFGVNEAELSPKYLFALFKSKPFIEFVNDKASGGVRMDFKIEYLQDWQIPLPPLEVQQEIVSAIEKQRQIIAGASGIEKSFSIEIELQNDLILTPIGEAVIDTRNGWSPVCHGGPQAVLTISCLQNGKIDFTQLKFTSETTKSVEKYFVREGDFFYSRGNTKELVALAAIAVAPVPNRIVFSDLLTRVEFDGDKILPEFAVYLFNSNLGRKYFGSVPEGGAPNMVKVSQEYMSNFRVPYFGQVQKQKEIVERLDMQINALEGVRLLRVQAEQRIEKILAEVWGEEDE